MSKSLDFAIGKRLPLDILMQPVFLEATRGWGKTSCAKALFEAGHDAGAQCITIAPAGKWWSLRLAADGKAPGLTDVFVFGGPHGDVPLTPESGATIAKLLVDKRTHAVLDVSLLRKGQRAKFLADFMEEFWLLKKLENDNYPVVLFIEEAHAVAPQNLRGNQLDEARMLGAIEDLASEGRNNGIGVVFLDQRAARVNKNVLALVEVLIVGRVIHPLDLKANGDWVTDKGAEDRTWLKNLPSLESGEAYVYAPVLGIFERLRIRMPRTFNATATAKIGERVMKFGALTQVDISSLRESMAQVIAEAEKNDPKALKREIAQLKAQLAKTPATAVVAASHPVTTRVEVPVLNAKDRQAIERLANQMESFYDRLSPLRITAVDLKDTLRATLNKWRGGAGVTTTVSPPVPTRPPVKPPPAHHSVSIQIVEPNGEARPIGKGERKMLEAISTRHPTPMSRAQIAALSGFSVKGGTFRTYLPNLKSAGLVEYQGDHVILTPAGVAAVSDAMAAAPQTTDDVLSQWRVKLRGGELKMFDALVSEYPNALSRERLGELSGFAVGGGTFRTYLPRLKTLGIVDYSGTNEVRASELLFPTGAPA